MIRTGKFGGMLSAASILNPNTANTALRYASSNIKEAAKIGLQSLYAHPEKVLEKYKDFDIVKAMKDRQDSKLLWVRARAIDANKINSNGDYFSEEEILKETEYKGSKVPAYKTFEGVPIYTNHKNDDIELAKGMVVYAEWDDEEKCVYCTFFIDEEAYPDVARGIRQGYVHDVSMGTSVLEGECSHCGNIATTEKMWCDCMKTYKSKKHPKSGKVVYEINRGLKFIELSAVGDGAFDLCEIQDLYEPEEIIQFSETINKKASEIQANVALAATFTPDSLTERYAYEDCLRVVSSTTDSILKLAQQAGNLVAGDILELPQASQNATVTNILQFLGIDPKSGLNILDLLNLALNFLEVSVMNLFAKKDNIDLAHVSKISKAMAELQTTMQDLIDDGAVGGMQPSAAPATPVPGQPVAPVQQAPGVGGVGTVISPQVAPAAPVPPAAPGVQPQAGIGGGIAEQTQAFAKTLNNLKNLKLALTQEDNEHLLNYNNVGEKIMSFISEFKHNFNQDKMVYEAEAPTGEKIAISSAGNVVAFNGSRKAAFAAALSDEEANLISEGDLKSAATSVLKRFMKFSSSSDLFEDSDNEESVLQKVNNIKEKAPTTHINERLKEKRIYDDEDEPANTLEMRTRPLRKNDYSTPTEKGLSKDGWSARKGTQNELKDKLLDVARRGVDDNVMEERLNEWRKTDGKVVQHIEKIISSLAKTTIKHGMHPREIMAAVEGLAEMGADPIGIAKELNSQGATVPELEGTPEKAVVDGLSEEVSETTSPGDIHAVLELISNNLEDAAKALQNAVDAIKSDEAVTPKIEDTLPSDDEQASADLATQADAAPTDVNPQDVQAGVSSMANTMDQLNVSTDDMLGSIKGLNATAAHKMIELEKQPTARFARFRNKARISYYGFNKKASKKDMIRSLFGELADYASSYNLRSKNLAQIITAMAATPNATRELVAQAMSEKKNIRTARTEITDSQFNEKTIRLTISDLPGVELSSPDFSDRLREKVVELLSGSGYEVDPTTFSMNEVNVSANGDIEVKVFTRFNRTYNPEDANGPEKYELDHTDSELPTEIASPLVPQGMEEPGIMESRSAKKNRLMQKYSQALPPMAGSPGLANPAAPGGAPAGAPAPADFMPPIGDEQPGTAAFTTPDADPMANEGDTPAGEGSVLPGVKKPWGTVCPQCQSINVEISNGDGKCNDCGAQLKYEFVVHVMPPAKNEEYKGTFDYKELEQAEGSLGQADAMGEMPADAGLGAATATETPGLGQMPEAPAPAMPAAPPVGGPMPAPGAVASGKLGMVRVSYISEPDVFLNANATKVTSKTPLPVGLTCPSCASRNVNKKDRFTFCSDCKTLAVSSITPMISDPQSLISSIQWMI